MSNLNNKIQEYIYDNINDGILIISEGIIEYANNSLYKFLHLQDGNIIGKNAALALPLHKENDEFFQTILETITGKHSSVKKTVYFVDDNFKKHLIALNVRYFNENKKLIIVINEINNSDEMLSTPTNIVNDIITDKIIKDSSLLKNIKDTANVSIMFSDVCGYTALSETMKTKDLEFMMKHYFKEIFKITDKYNCCVVELMGDGILGIFGIDGNKNHADNAVACAIEMQQVMHKINNWNTKHSFSKIAMGIGIHTGDINVIKIGAQNYSKYTIIGKDVNIASRVQSYSVGQQIYISQTTKDAIKGEVFIEEQNKILPKGSDSVLCIYSINGIKGKYTLNYKMDLTAAKYLTENVKIEFYYLHKKIVFFKKQYANLVAISKDYVIIDTTNNIKLFDNILFKYKGNNYAKVVNEHDNRYVLRITYLSPDLKEYIQCHFL